MGWVGFVRRLSEAGKPVSRRSLLRSSSLKALLFLCSAVRAGVSPGSENLTDRVGLVETAATKGLARPPRPRLPPARAPPSKHSISTRPAAACLPRAGHHRHDLVLHGPGGRLLDPETAPQLDGAMKGGSVSSMLPGSGWVSKEFAIVRMELNICASCGVPKGLSPISRISYDPAPYDRVSERKPVFDPFPFTL